MPIRRVNVNTSKPSYSIDADGKSIRKGLTTIRGLGPVCAKELDEKGPFTSLDDIARKCLPRRVTGVRKLLLGTHPGMCGGNIEALYEADALVGLEFEPKETIDGPE